MHIILLKLILIIEINRDFDWKKFIQLLIDSYYNLTWLPIKSFVKLCVESIFLYLCRNKDILLDNTDFMNNIYTYSLLLIWLGIISIAVFTIWSRGVGPRFRPDQMSDLVWKDVVIYLFIVLVIILVIMYTVMCAMI